MTEIIHMTSPNSPGTGKDPNDSRDDPGYRDRVEAAFGSKTHKDPFDWAEEFTLSASEAEAISNPDWIIENLIIQGHLCAIVAEPNGGKTTILFYLAGSMADKGYKVFYVNADVSGGDAKNMVFEAKERGFALLLPDMKVGLSMSDVVDRLEAMNSARSDFSSVVFIFDTLKKMTDVINKSKAKALYALLRSMSAKGMTIVLLAHTNKYDGPDGKPIYEGTGDLRSDVDDLIYLIPKMNEDGSMTISTEPDKKRGAFEPITYVISPEREVQVQEEYVDVIEIRKAQVQREHDQAAIEEVTASIKAGKFKHGEIIAFCKERGMGWRTVEAVLKRYQRQPIKLWTKKKGFNNAWIYYLEVYPLSSGEMVKR